MKEKFTLKTSSGCLRSLALLLCIVLLSSFFAQLISTDFGRIKNDPICIDTRGASLTGDLYYPLGTSDKDSLPAVIVVHGGGAQRGVTRGIAEEIAHRGFVVLNLDAYGAGLSEQPISDDGGQGAESFSIFGGPQGVLDAANYLKSLTYVDSTRIGLVGHSLGAGRISFAAIADCGYYTLNDLLLNLLYDSFDIEIAANEITKPADEIASAKLNADQLKYYEYRKTEISEEYNSKIKSVCVLGSDVKYVGGQTVVVAGHEVFRSLQTNVGIINGSYDNEGRYNYNSQDRAKESWYTGSEDIIPETWYAIDDTTASSQILGGLYQISYESSPLAEAVENRCARIFMTNEEVHSKNVFSAATASDIVKICEQVLNYNGGNLTDGSLDIVDASHSSFIWRAILNCIAMLAMLGMIFPLVALLTKTKFFASVISSDEIVISKAAAYNKKTYWLFAAITIAYTFFGVHMGNTKGVMRFPLNHFWPLSGTIGVAVLFVLILGICSLIMLTVYALIGKKKHGETGLSPLFAKTSVANVFKSLLLSLIALIVGYLLLEVTKYLFNQDFRLWATSFASMRAEYWPIAARYAIFFLPIYIVSGAFTNYTIRTDIPQWKDTLVNVLIGSLGVWLCCFVNILLCKFAWSGTQFSSFDCSYSMLLYIPITIYISRKLYLITKNIWTGAFVNTVFLAWSLTASQALADSYYGQDLLSTLLGF